MKSNLDNLPIFDQELQRSFPNHRFTLLQDDTLPRDVAVVEQLASEVLVKSSTSLGAEIGCVWALHEIGHRYYTPLLEFIPRVPQSIRTTTVKPAWHNRSLWLAYGHGGSNRDQRNLDQVRFETLNGFRHSYANSGHSWRNMRLRLEASFAKCQSGYEDLVPNNVMPSDLFGGPNGDTLNVHHALAVTLIARERYNLIKEQRQADPLAYMVSLDAADSDQTDSETFYRWANQVTKEIHRLETEETGEEPTIWTGMYAYAGHRLPPSFDLEKNTHVQVALGFNRTELTYNELIEQYGQKASEVGIRGYADVQVWTHGHPGQAHLASYKHWVEDVPLYHSLGARAFNYESTANYMTNLWGLQCARAAMWDGTPKASTILNEIVQNVFAGSRKVKELYEYWAGKPPLNAFLFRRSFDLVSEVRTEGMCPEDRLRDLEDMLIIQWERFVLGQESTTAYEPLLEWAKHVHAVRDRWIIHTYANQRRLLNGHVMERYPDLWMFRESKGGPKPLWEIEPPSQPLSAHLFDVCHQEVIAATQVTDWSEDLVPVTTEKPPKAASSLKTRSALRLAMYGPCRLLINGVETLNSEGLTIIDTPANTVLTEITGIVAVKCHPENPPFLDQGIGQDWFVYNLPSYLRPDEGSTFNITTDIRNVLIQNNIRTDVIGKYTEVIAEPGSLLVHGVNMKGTMEIHDNPPWMINRQDVYLFPAELTNQTWTLKNEE